MDFAQVTGWKSVIGGTSRQAVVADADDATYVVTSENPAGEVLQLTLPPLAEPSSDVTVSLRLSTNEGTGTIVPELYVANDATWVPATSLAVAGAASDYQAVWTLSGLSGITPAQWASGVVMRLVASTNANLQPIFQQVASSSVQPIKLGIVTATGVDIDYGANWQGVHVRLHTASVTGAPPVIEDADLGTVGNRPAVLTPPDATSTGLRQATTQTMSGSAALTAVLAAPVEEDGFRYLRRVHISGGIAFNNANHHNIIFEDCLIDGGLYTVNSFYNAGGVQPAGDWPEFRYCEISGGTSTCVIGSHVRLLRCNIHDGPINIRPYGNFEVYASYNWGTYHFEGAHCDLFQFFASTGDVLIHWNNLPAFNSPNSPDGSGGEPSSSCLQSGTLTGNVYGPNEFLNNWIDGGGYTLRGRKPTDSQWACEYTFRNNKMGRNFRFGPLQNYGYEGFDFDNSNTWLDTGLPVLS